MIHLYNKGDVTNIIVQNIISKEDSQDIIKALDNYKNIEITFIDIQHISADIILKIDKFAGNIKLVTNNKTLWIYLKKIGIQVKLNRSNRNYAPLVHHDIEAIAIGGSAGSLKSMVSVIKSLPFCDISVFVVMHILPDQKSKLVEILQPETQFRVKEAVNGEKIEKGFVYVAPPDLHMQIQNGYIQTLKTQKVNFCRPAIDVLFKSLALEYKETLVTVLTCGYLDDGSRSLSIVKENNGISIIQNPNQCEANDIPLNAMSTRNYDFVFDIEDIGEYLKNKLNFTVNLEERVLYLMKEIYKKYGYDFTNYDKSSLVRRVELLRQELGIEHFSDMENIILNDHEIFELLFEKLSINVSEFFRDTDTFIQFKEQILPIMESYSHIRIWCAGSSKGQEAYSIAIMLAEYGLLERSIIYATDFNGLVLEQAKNGIYSKKEYQQCEKNYLKFNSKIPLENWFEVEKDYVMVKNEIKRKVHFFQHNLVTDGEINEFHIVFCRNVLIYFNEKLQHKVLSLIYDSLVRDGYLVLGDYELINSENRFKRLKNNSNSKVFKKLYLKGDL